jgi:hypothetical protein
MKMSKKATREYIVRMRGRYRAMKSKKAKGRVLDDFCATTELERKHVIKVLRGSAEPLKRSGRKAVYGPEVAEALKDLWIKAAQPCSKLMHPMMGCYVSSYEKMHGAFDSDLQEQLLRVSASSMDRLLKPKRILSPRRRRSPMGVAAVKKEVPIRAGEWEVTEPGWIEADTVAHGGGNMAGSFAWSLTMTDILTQWTEVRVMWNRGAAATFERIQEIEQALPFIIQGFDSDNGPEFMNWHLFDYFRSSSKPVSFTRSRAYQKNDNAHVEQKNGTHVRGLLGHDRIEDPEGVEALNQAIRLWSLWKNLYSPAMKLVSKTRIGHRYIKRYDAPRTPAQRALACALVPKDQKTRIRTLLATTDCFRLKQHVDEALRAVFAAIRQRQEEPERHPAFPGSGTSALRAAPSGTIPSPGKAGREPRAMPFQTSLRRSKQPERMVS